ncbi:MAG: TonB-dependent receptor [Phaeodactylibacter sp.]|nr:TonB-dependent receptor [Phaeodactylibacter sp.]
MVTSLTAFHGPTGIAGDNGLLFPEAITVTGKVTSEDSPEGLPGVNVTVKGTSLGTVTDINGTFSIEVPSEESVLVFSFIGYERQEVRVGNQTVINVGLLPDARTLDEVVVIGYGTQTKRDLTGSVSKLTDENFNQSVNTSIEQLIEGKAAGVQVVQNSGEPGGGMSIDIRGVGSINAGSAPLYVVDGLPIENSVLIGGTGNQVAPTRSPRNPISFLNPADIASIEILKDASATAIYGARGANGVILITTKSGASGQLKIDYNGHVGFNTVHNRLGLLQPQDYMEGINSLIEAGGGDPTERVTGIQAGGTDWQEVIYRDQALLQKHNLSFSWGNNQTTYLVAVNNTREEGLVEKTSFNRFGGRFNLNHSTDRFNFGISATSSYIRDIFVPNGFDVNLRGGAINAAKLYDPTLGIRDENGDYIITEFMDIDNPLAIITGNHMEGNRYRYLGTVFAEYFVLPSLSVKVRAGGDANNEDKTIYKDRTTIIGNSLGGVATAYNGAQTNYLVEGTLNFFENFGDHDVGILAGATTQKFMTRFSEQQANNFTTDATLANNFGLADRSTLINNSFKETNTLLSYLGRVNYKYRDKYLLTASYRIDGSSRFGEGNRFGFFPSFSLGWLIDQESFFPSTDVIDMLKLRGSWGQTGNQEIGNNNAIVTFASGSRTSYVLDDQFVTSLNPTRIANPDLQWETTEQIDIGIDFSLYAGRISGSIDWYQKKTTDMLLNLPIPRSSGYSSRLVNIGSMENSGFEFALTTYNVTGRDFSWSSDLNFYTLKNEVTELGGIPRILTGSFSAAAGNISIIEPGQPLRSFYGHEVVGIWQEGDDFSSITNNVSPGDFKFRDVNGDGTIDGDDRVILGNSFPDFTWGFGNTFKFKNLSLYVFFRGVEGVSMINGNLLEQYFPRSGVRINRFAEPFLNRWTPSNPTNAEPSYLNVDQHSQGVNSRTVSDASFIKLQTVRLSYTVPARLIQGAFRSIEVYATGINLLTFSDYEGHDPALNPNGSANFRIDWNGYPSATSFLFGLNLGF